MAPGIALYFCPGVYNRAGLRRDPLQFIFGLYRDSSWLVVVANILIFAAILKVRGNMARLVDRLRH